MSGTAVERRMQQSCRRAPYACSVSTRTDDIQRRTISSTVRWIVIGLVVLSGAYVCGRAVGILLDVNPHATEGAAIIVVIAVAVWPAARRRR
jgi:hypothetical protein